VFVSSANPSERSLYPHFFRWVNDGRDLKALLHDGSPQNSVVTILYTNGFCHVDLGNTSKVQSGPPVCGVEVPVGPYLPPHALLTITFKGRMTHADNDRWCTTPGRLARKARRPCTSSSWSRCSRRRLSMESRWTTKKVVHWLPSRPITAGREVLPAIARHSSALVPHARVDVENDRRRRHGR